MTIEGDDGDHVMLNPWTLMVRNFTLSRQEGEGGGALYRCTVVGLDRDLVRTFNLSLSSSECVCVCVCVCVCMCMCVCVYVCIYVCYVCMYVCMHAQCN